MPTRTILSLPEFVHELPGLRKRRSRLATVRPGLKLEHREEHVRLGLQKSVRRVTLQERSACGEGQRP